MDEITAFSRKLLLSVFGNLRPGTEPKGPTRASDPRNPPPVAPPPERSGHPDPEPDGREEGDGER